jgi:hypothetical protein
VIARTGAPAAPVSSSSNFFTMRLAFITASSTLMFYKRCIWIIAKTRILLLENGLIFFKSHHRKLMHLLGECSVLRLKITGQRKHVASRMFRLRGDGVEIAQMHSADTTAIKSPRICIHGTALEFKHAWTKLDFLPTVDASCKSCDLAMKRWRIHIAQPSH